MPKKAAAFFRSKINEGMKEGLTFDDVLLMPRFSSITSRLDVSTKTRFSKSIELALPIVSANMDTVTENNMAIAMAKLGGIGVIHRFLTIEEQVEQVRKVKRSEGIIIENPVTLNRKSTVGDANDLISRQGFGGIVIVDNDNRIEGLVTRRDLSFADNMDEKLENIMTMKKDMITAQQGVSLEKARELLQKNRIEKLPIVDRSGRLSGLITAKDLIKIRERPHSTKDRKGRFMVAAAVGIKSEDIERAEALVHSGADALVVDIAHGHSMHCINMIKRLKKDFDVDIIGGNIATEKAAEDLISAGADAVKVGIGPGSVCTTRIVAGVGVPQLTAIADCSDISESYGVPIIADGGIRKPGDVAKAIAAGASTVMVGTLFVGTDESPGPIILRDGVKYKLTRGMASMTASLDRKRVIKEKIGNVNVDSISEFAEQAVPEGVEGFTQYKGGISEVVGQLVGGLRSGMSYCNSGNIKEFRKNSQFIRVTGHGLAESLPHDIHDI